MPHRLLRIYGLQALAAVWTAGIAVLSLAPAEFAVSTDIWDKLEHGLAFGVLAILVRTAWVHWNGVLVWIGTTCYGVLIEVGQLLSPGRYADAMDASANALGALIGVGSLLLWQHSRRSLARPESNGKHPS